MAMMAKDEIYKAINTDLMPAFRAESERLDWIDKWARWKHEEILIPPKATKELKQLRDMAKTPWLSLIVTTISQAMFADSYRGSTDEITKAVWRTWQANDLDHHQIAIHRAALEYGYAYESVLPGQNATGSTAVMRGISPRKMFARYADPLDDWPKYALYVHKQDDSTWLLRFYDDTAVHYLSADSSGAGLKYLSYDEHGAGVCPIVRFANMLDLDGRTVGEVEPFIELAKRINKTVLDRLTVQHFASWKVRYGTGLSLPDDDEAANHAVTELAVADILTAEVADAKFGTLDASPLSPFIEALKSDVQALAAASQTPTHALTGDLINISAEGLAAARASLTQKVYERQHSFGKSHAQALRLAMVLQGNRAAAEDLSGRMSWQDTSIRSMAQAVDALGKMAQMLGVPVQVLWGRIPGVEQSDVEEWKRIVAEQDANDPLARLNASLDAQAGGEPAGPPADDQPPAAA